MTIRKTQGRTVGSVGRRKTIKQSGQSSDTSGVHVASTVGGGWFSAKAGKWAALLIGIAVLQGVFGLIVAYVRSTSTLQVEGQDFLVAENGVGGPLAVFAEPDAPIRVKISGNPAEDPNLRDPSNIAILVLATGRKAWLLRATLRSLSRVDGLDPRSILVTQAFPGEASRLAVQGEFKLAWAGPAGTSVSSGESGSSALRRQALDTRLSGNFKEAASPGRHLHRSLELAERYFKSEHYRLLLVLDEGQFFSLDMLWFFIQLEPAIQRDSSLWCASAWNENGLAAFVADSTVVLRSDWFSVIAWSVPLDVLHSYLLPNWPEDRETWKSWLRHVFQSKGKQCLFPELPRVALASAECLRAGAGSSAADSTPESIAAAFRMQQAPVTAAPATCSDEDVYSQRLSALSIVSGALRVNIGDVSRLGADNYRDFFLWRWPGRQGMFYTRPLSSISELEAYLGYELVFMAPESQAMSGYGYGRQALGQAPLRLIIQRPRVETHSGERAGPGHKVPTQSDAWREVATYFGFSTSEPHGMYHGVLRIWWRNLILYLVVDPESPLLVATEDFQRKGRWLRALSKDSKSPQIPSSAFTDQLADVTLPPQRPVPPGAAVGAAPMGESCANHCEARGQICVDADLAAVAKCAAPLTMVFQCKGCDAVAADAAFPGQNHDTGRCAAGLPAPEAPSGAGLTAGDCAKRSARIRRLCICRLPAAQLRKKAGAPSVLLLSPGRRFAREAPKTEMTAVPQTSALRLGAVQAAADKISQGSVELSRFALANFPGQKPSNFLLQSARQILVLVIAPKGTLLKRTLGALQNVTGLQPGQVLVAYPFTDSPGIKSLIQAMGFHGLQLSSWTRGTSSGQVFSAGYRDALQGAVDLAKSIKANSVLVLEEGLRISMDILSFFSQLLPVLIKDASLWCISGWNDNGLAPYVADATVVMRTDWFSGVAWLSTVAVLVQDVLPKWTGSWQSHLSKVFARSGLQCLVPEVSRAVPDAGSVAAAAGLALTELPASQDFILKGSPVCSSDWVDLGSVERLQQENYLKLFLEDWPGEGLLNAKPLASLRTLADGRANSGGPYILSFKNKDYDNDDTWKAVATFLGLWQEAHIRCSYLGVLRLRWRHSVLFLVPSSSPFAAISANVHASDFPALPVHMFNATRVSVTSMHFHASFVLEPMLFYSLTPPLLLPAGGEVRAAAGPGQDCFHTCRSRGLACLDEDLLFPNNCATLSSLLQCSACEPGQASQLPAQVMDPGSDYHRVCRFNVGSAKQHCAARSETLRRVCTCRRGVTDAGGTLSLSTASKWDAEGEQTEAPPDSLLEGDSPLEFLHEQLEEHREKDIAPSFAHDLETQPGDLPILVIASGHRPQDLEQSLKSLARLSGYNPEQILVSQNRPEAASERIAKMMFNVSWVLLEQEISLNFESSVTEHHRSAIKYALNTRFPRARSLLVVEEDMEAAPDMLWFFAQLEPLLHKEQELWCISAWNDNGIAPYAVDLTGLIRTDVFSVGLAWMLPARLFRAEFLPRWPKTDWVRFLQNQGKAAGRQCVVPEISRARHVGRMTGKDEAGAPAKAARRDAAIFFAAEGPKACDLRHAILGLDKEIYFANMVSGLRTAKLLQDLSELPALMAEPLSGGGQVEQWQNIKPYRMHFESRSPQPAPEAWAKLASFFRLSQASPPRGLYKGVLRLRWGASGVLFLVASSSSLATAAEVSVQTAALDPQVFQATSSPLMLPPVAVVAAGREDVGRSCTSICASSDRDCFPADLFFLNSCLALRKFHACSRCEASAGSDQPALVAPRRGQKISGSCLFNTDLVQHPLTCDASHSDTRRLCACRRPLVAAESTSNSTQAAEIALPDAAKKAARPRPASPEALAATAEAVGWKPGIRAQAWHKMPLAAFAAQKGIGATKELSIVMLAPGDNVAALRASLASLKRTIGYSSSRVLVSLGCCGQEVEQAKLTLETEFADLPLTIQEAAAPGAEARGSRGSRVAEHSARDSWHFKDAVGRALAGRFNSSQSVLLLEEGTLLSPDALGYFAQLEPLLHEDPTLWCIGAWNDAGLAPYVTDLTALLRTDWHPGGFAWMLRSLEFLQELLPQWPEADWPRFLRQAEVRKGRQCVVPEVSRCHPYGPPATQDDPMLQRREKAFFEMHQLPILWNQETSEVNLGDVQRMLANRYEKLLIHDWPGAEGLALSKPVDSVRVLMTLDSGNHRLVVDDTVGSWPKAAAFLRLWPAMEPMIRASFRGSLRLRWRGAVLHVILSSSPLLKSAGLALQRGFSGRDFPRSQPEIRAPTVSVVVGKLGESCSETCANWDNGQGCHDPDLFFLNGCATLRSHLGFEACSECLASGVGQEQPSVVLMTSDLSVTGATHSKPGVQDKEVPKGEPGPAVGTCLWSANYANPPSCRASHQRMARLCPCRASMPDTALYEDATLLPRNRSIPTEMVPSGQLDASLPSQRCGALFGNHLAADCEADGLWCCSAGMWCGRSDQHCRSPDDECFEGASSSTFCGGGWTLRTPKFGLRSVADR